VPRTVLVERAVDDRQDSLSIEPGQAAAVNEVLVVPQEEGTLDHLEVIRVKAPRQISEEGLADLIELVGSEQLENFLQFVQEEDLLSGARPGPALEEPVEDGCGGVGIFLDVLNDAVRQLLMVQSHALGLVEGDQSPDQELQVLLLQGDGKSINDGA